MIGESGRQRLERDILALWYPDAAGRCAPWWLRGLYWPVLVPLSRVVAHIATARRQRLLARRTTDRQTTPPVIVIGNVVSGGTGKTPIVAALAIALARAGFRPGIITRNYRAKGTTRSNRRQGQLVHADSPADQVGDEALLLARRTGLPVASGAARREVLATLLAEHPGLDVVLSDDGLQHEPLPRTLEIAVLDERGIGNGRCLPAGPLREPAANLLEHLDLWIANGLEPAALQALLTRQGMPPPGIQPPCHRSDLRPDRLQWLDGTDGPGVAQLQEQQRSGQVPIHAFAGIARPERFFRTLRELGLEPDQTWALPDHAHVDPDWLAALPAGWILTTAKDAVKCPDLPSLRTRCLVLQMRAVPDERLIHWLTARLNRTQDP